MKKSVALVLSSGGSKGLAHIGVIQEIERQGFEITSIAGSSIGSVIGGLYAMDKLEDYTRWVKTLNRKLIWELLDFTFSSNGLLKGDRVLNKMKSFIPDESIESMRIPFSAVATDIVNEKPVVFSSGSFYNSIRASFAIPSVITPVKHDGTILVDGGVLDPIPIEYVSRKAGDILVVVNLYGDKTVEGIIPVKENKVYKNSILNSVSNSLTKFRSSENDKNLSYYALLTATAHAMVHKLARENISKHQPDVVINIPYDSAGTFDFHKADQLIELGRKAAEKELLIYKNDKS